MSAETILYAADEAPEPVETHPVPKETTEAPEAAESDDVVLVDQPGPEDYDWLSEIEKRTKNRLPLVPLWARSVKSAASVLWWITNHYVYVVLYHLSRSPKYLLRLALQAPLGTWRVIREVGSWVADVEGRPLRKNSALTKDSETYLKLAKIHDQRIRFRLPVFLIAAVTAMWLIRLGQETAPAYAQMAAAGITIIILGVIGCQADQPVFDRAVVPSQVQKLTSDVVINALGSLGIAELNRAITKGTGVTFPDPITRDGPGWRADVDLPFGVTATDIMERRERLASALRRPLGSVWPEQSGLHHPGRLVLWVSDQDMSKNKQPAWPLAKVGRTDLFKPVPFGTDQRGRVISIPLMYRNMLIGAMPGFGKTFALRVLLLAASLDPSAELRVFELKGTGDLKPLAKVAHHYASGAKDSTIEACVESLREVYKDLERRAEVIDGLPDEVCPENKVTPELSAQRSLGLHPLVFAIDECQELFSHEEFGEEAGKLCTAIIKRGRALGIILLLATQRPDKTSLPTGVSANVLVRFCLKVAGQLENDMILGTSCYKNGIRATMFTDQDLGIGYLLGVSTLARVIRSFYLDTVISNKITDRALAMRKAAGTLTGFAAGQMTVTSKPSYDLLTDILTVVPATEEKVWNSVVVDRLAQLRPEIYGPWAEQEDEAKTAHLTTMLKPYFVKVDQVYKSVNGKGINRRGITRQAVAEAANRRIRRVK